MTSAPWRLRQEDGCEFEARLSYIANKILLLRSSPEMPSSVSFRVLCLPYCCLGTRMSFVPTFLDRKTELSFHPLSSIIVRTQPILEGKFNRIPHGDGDSLVESKVSGDSPCPD